MKEAAEALDLTRHTVHVHKAGARRVFVERRDGSVSVATTADVMSTLLEQESLVAQAAVEETRHARTRICKSCGSTFIDRPSSHVTCQTHCIDCIETRFINDI